VRRQEASLWHRCGGRPFPGGETILIVSTAPWARETLLLKWAFGEREGVNQ